MQNLNAVHQLSTKNSNKKHHLFFFLNHLDQFPSPSIPDVQSLFQRIFVTHLNPSLSFVKFLLRLKNFILLICQWVVTSDRLGRGLHIFTAASLFNKLKTFTQNMSFVDKAEPVQITALFQSIFMEYLDHFSATKMKQLGAINNKNQNQKYEEQFKQDYQFQQCCKFFTYLMRSSIFSHDAFLRTLISRGILEEGLKESDSFLNFLGFIKFLPILPGPDFQHESNQRNQILNALNIEVISFRWFQTNLSF